MLLPGKLTSLLPMVPLLLKTLILRILGMSPASAKQDLRTELVVTMIRSLMTPTEGVGASQGKSIRGTPAKGPMWISSVTLPRPEDDVRTAVFKAIEALNTTGDETYALPTVVPVEAEWTGYRHGVEKDAPLPDLSEEEKYRMLRKESGEMVVLYLHGGAYM